MNSKPSDWDDIRELFGPSFEESLKAGDIDRHVAAIETFRSRVPPSCPQPRAQRHDRADLRPHADHEPPRRLAARSRRGGHPAVSRVLAAIMRGDAEEAELRIRELNRDARAYIERYKDYVI